MPPRTRRTATPAVETPDASRDEPIEPEPPDRTRGDSGPDEPPTRNDEGPSDDGPSRPSQTAESKIDMLNASMQSYIAYLRDRDERESAERARRDEETRRRADTLDRQLVQLSEDIRMSYGTIEGLLRKRTNTTVREQGTEGSTTPDEALLPRQGESPKGKERAGEPYSQFPRVHRLPHISESPISQQAERPLPFEQAFLPHETNEEDEPSGPPPRLAPSAPRTQSRRVTSRTLTGDDQAFPDLRRGTGNEEPGVREGHWSYDRTNARRQRPASQEREQARQGPHVEAQPQGNTRWEIPPSREPSLPRSTTFDWRGLASGGWGNVGGRGNEPNTGSSPWTSFQQRIHEGIDRVLRNTLGGPTVTLPSHQFVKTLSASTKPPLYEGEDDLPAFMEWFQNLMTFFELHLLTSFETDRQRVLVCSSALQGKAAHWYHLYFRKESTRAPALGFANIIHSLADRFITPAAAIRAQNNFERVKYRLERGIRTFITELEIHASHMFQPVDDYTMRRLVIEALPPKMRNDLMDHKGLSVTTSSIEAWLEAIERREHELLERQAFNDMDSAHRSALPHTVSGSRPSTQPPRATPELPSRVTPAPPTMTAQPSRAAKSTTPAPRTNERATSTGPRVQTRQPLPVSEITCFACGQKGHFRGAKECPMTPKTVHINVLRGNEHEGDANDKYLAETGEDEQHDYPGETYEDSYEDPGYDDRRVVVYDDLDEYGATIASMQIVEESDDPLHVAAVTAASAAGDVSLANDIVTAVKNQYELRGSGHAPKPTGRTAKQIKDDSRKNWASQTNVRPARVQTDQINRQGLTAIIKVDGLDAYTCWDSV